MKPYRSLYVDTYFIHGGVWWSGGRGGRVVCSQCGRAETQPLLVKFPLNGNGARRPVAGPALKLQGLPISRRQKQAE
jgi:hypothetical protein